MTNRGANSNGSQFFITAIKTGWIDGRHVIFGQVLSGQEHIDAVEKLGSGSGRLQKPVTILDSGELPL